MSNSLGITITNESLLRTIRSACGNDVPVFFAEEGFACMRDFLDHERSSGTTRFAGFLYRYDLLNDRSKRFVTVSHANGMYMIEKAIPDEYIRIRERDRENRLCDVRRFFTKDFSIHDKTECDICFGKIDHDLSTDVFNRTYRSCPRCFNVICRLCVTRTALHTNSLACPFCKFS